MLLTRRQALAALAAALAGCGPRAVPPPPASADRIDAALARAAAYLIKLQHIDGAWRSDFYGPFKDGPSLTPLVLEALQAASSSPEIQTACEKAAAYLAAMARPDGTLDEGQYGLGYPVYTSALTVVTLSHPALAMHRPARDTWLAYLRQRQLTEALGWQTADRPYGGWGYCARLPRKPASGAFAPSLLESNLSATVFALDALRAAGCADDGAYKAAMVFVKRCQNWADDAPQRDPAFDDGGFFFIYDDAVRNKAGVAGKDRSGRERFASYGSTTADGLRALLHCGLPAGDARAAAAHAWLEKNFDAANHPGRYVASRTSERNAVYYYYARSLALTLRLLGGHPDWAAGLVGELLKRQQGDGSWVNDALAQRENDPLVATAEAVVALAACRPNSV